MTDDKVRRSREESWRQEASQNSATAQFEAVFLEHWQPIYRVLVRLVGDHADAEDLALETFWQLYHRPPSNEHGRNLGGWLYRVATNLGLNALRARKRRARHEQEAERRQAEQISADASDPADPDRDEERARVRAVLAGMDSRQAQLLLLRYSGLSYKELAGALDVSANSVGTLLVRAEREFELRYRAMGG